MICPLHLFTLCCSFALFYFLELLDSLVRRLLLKTWLRIYRLKLCLVAWNTPGGQRCLHIFIILSFSDSIIWESYLLCDRVVPDSTRCKSMHFAVTRANAVIVLGLLEVCVFVSAGHDTVALVDGFTHLERL